MQIFHQTTVLAGRVDEIGPLYTRLLATDPSGPNAGDLLLTAEVYRDLEDGRPAFPIYRSSDGGSTWQLIAQVRDDALLLGHRHQPVLYELPEPFAGLPAGAILLAGNAIPRDMSSTHLVLYSSTDGGVSWVYRSTIDAGGPAVCDSSAEATTTSVWEPDLLLVEGTLLCYFADERRKPEGMHQSISLRTTTDLQEWSEPTLVKGVPDSVSRPGMFVSTGRMPNGGYGAVMEVVGEPGVPVRWVTSADGIDWGPTDDLGARLVSERGVALTATPNVYWRSEPSGAISVIATGRTAIHPSGELVNIALLNGDGGRGVWHEIDLPTAADRVMGGDDSGYSQSLAWNRDGDLVHATTLRNSRGSNDVVVTVARY
ncbi:sialidase family protein [Lacisediminihabitans sp. FW035]